MQTVKRDLKTVMLGLAFRAFCKSHPLASPDEAWAAARRTAPLYRNNAITFLTLLELDRQTSAAAREQRN